jgi:UDP-N-acetylglucosamine--N-acetylmuramyl-(pentapeptide) pyrophosphoryl-undecaprenol N-acetylglucosamine transferase
MPKTIIFAGGGSSGHLMPSMAVADVLRKKDPSINIEFIITDRADEQTTLQTFGYSYHIIHAGKFPRGLSIRIITFPILFIVSFFESIALLRRRQPSLIVSKGGFVSVPVCLAAKVLGIPVVLHASDSVPSLSDTVIGRIARKIYTGFPISSFPVSLHAKAVQTGNPVRPMIGSGTVAAGQRITGFSSRKPILMIIGGSQGSLAINQAIEKHFNELIDLADIIHLTGGGKSINRSHARYFSRTYVLEELPHLYEISDLVLTRAGAGTLSELGSLKKAAVVVPLPGVAHDHQIRNAEFLASHGAAEHLPQERLGELPSVLRVLLGNAERRQSMAEALHTLLPANASEKVATAILDVLAERG